MPLSALGTFSSQHLPTCSLFWGRTSVAAQVDRAEDLVVDARNTKYVSAYLDDDFHPKLMGVTDPGEGV